MAFPSFSFMSRRSFLTGAAGGIPAAWAFFSSCSRDSQPSKGSVSPRESSAGRSPIPQASNPREPSSNLLFPISLAEWSLHRTLNSGELDHLDFPRAAREDYGIEAVEYVNSFFKDQAENSPYLTELRDRCRDAGVRSLLIMCDGEGAIGDPDPAARLQTVENHRPWVEAAAFLGCHSIRVNAQSRGTPEEQRKLVADGLRRLAEFADSRDINVLVENHGGLSSDGAWLASVMKEVGHPRCGTLPDFGNFDLGNGRRYDPYRGVEELMPYARAVSAKSHAFDSGGDERDKDFLRLMRIVLRAGYRGYVGVEYEGSGLPEREGIRATKALLERVRDTLTPEFAA